MGRKGTEPGNTAIGETGWGARQDGILDMTQQDAVGQGVARCCKMELGRIGCHSNQCHGIGCCGMEGVVCDSKGYKRDKVQQLEDRIFFASSHNFITNQIITQNYNFTRIQSKLPPPRNQ